jgi:glycosyltransferase involved in cell wall biosynthesis
MKSSNKINILVVGHEASLTGAPLLLLSYLRELKKNNKQVNFRVLLADGGSLLPQYLEVGDTFYDLIHFKSHPWLMLILRIAAKLLSVFKHLDLRLALWLAKSPLPDLIYVNTVASIPSLTRLAKHLPSQIPIVIHVHEMDLTLKRYEYRNSIGWALIKAARIIAPCSAVSKSLQELFPDLSAKISIVNEWICRPLVDPTLYKRDSRHHIRNKLGLLSTDILCIFVGQMQWRKGSDLLPQIVKKCCDINTSMYFVWIGHGSDDHLLQLHTEIARMGVSSNCYLVGEQQDPYPFFAAADIFLLPSREDPYPVVMLEAALFSLPIVCFDHSGGASDFVNNKLGISVPYLDVDLFSSAALKLASNSALRKSMVVGESSVMLESHMAYNVANRLSRILIDTIGHQGPVR